MALLTVKMLKNWEYLNRFFQNDTTSQPEKLESSNIIENSLYAISWHDSLPRLSSQIPWTYRVILDRLLFQLVHGATYRGLWKNEPL